ncbi:MAG: retroviral-like aspartic protease family protein [Gammaproteobacteria bacterium]|nr:retroviral-like aspartic protease family protein [Gammaproteobacteria bacterium]
MNNNFNPDHTAQAEKKLGKKMLIIAWLIFLGFLVLLFRWYAMKTNGAYNTVTYQKPNGGYEMVVPLTDGSRYEVIGQVNEYETHFLIDTGATSIAVPQSVAEKAGLAQGMPIDIMTAGGRTKAYLTKIKKLTIGTNIVLQNINATINPDMPGDTVLLGMGALKQLTIKQSNNTLTLIQN